MFGDGPRRRGRSDQTTSKTPPSGPITDVFGAELSTSEISRVFGGTNNGVFRSSTTRAILVTACFAFVMISLVGAWSARRSTSIKDISDAVMKLSLQLREAELENERHVRQLQIYDKEVSDKDVELAWEHQHVDDAEEALKIERRSALGQIEKDRKAIKEAAELLDELADEVTAKEIQIQKEHQESEKNKWMLDVTVESLMAQEARHKMESEENADLKNQLAHAIEDLANIRAQLPLAPGSGGQAEDFYLRRNKRKLRGKSNYQPGDNVEIIEYQGGGRIALQPGIVHEINANDTYNLVRLDLSIMVPNMRMEHFHTYQVYDEGTPALLHNNPVTIVGFIKNSAPDGFEIHGYYDLTIDQDPTKTIRQISAMTVHRYADRDEIFGEDSEL